MGEVASITPEPNQKFTRDCSKHLSLFQRNTPTGKPLLAGNLFLSGKRAPSDLHWVFIMETVFL